jgi:hypothetical protein
MTGRLAPRCSARRTNARPALRQRASLHPRALALRRRAARLLRARPRSATKIAVRHRNPWGEKGIQEVREGGNGERLVMVVRGE